LIGIIFLLLEVSFFNRGLIFSLLVSTGMMYIGRKRMPLTSGKVLFWGGVLTFFISIVNMMTLKFFLLALLIHLVIQFARSKKNPDRIRPIVKEIVVDPNPKTPIVRKQPLFENVLFGEQRTPEHVYEWNDINIQAGIGDTIIDLSYTVLPKGETVIFVRNFVGNVKVLIPYDIEVNVSHSVMAGTANILGHQDGRVFNQAIHFQTEEYEKAEQKVKIFTSFLVGDLEVKRV